MKILIVRGAGGDIYETAWSRALNELGHESEIFATHANDTLSLLAKAQRKLLRIPLAQEILGQLLLKRIKLSKPQVMLFYQAQFFNYETIQEATKSGFVCGYHNDDPFGPRSQAWRFVQHRQSLPLYHGYHVYRPVNIEEAKNCGAKNVKLLMPYYIPWRDYELGPDERISQRFKSDLVFAGHYETDMRLDCLSKAAKSDIKVRIFGASEWAKHLDQATNKVLGPIFPVLGMQYREALCASKIASCFLSKANRDQYTRRVFEIPAMRLFLLCERSNIMPELFTEDKEAVFFSSAEEFLSKAHFYLKRESLRQQIAAAAQQRAKQSGYDIYSRMRQWLRDIEEWMK